MKANQETSDHEGAGMLGFALFCCFVAGAAGLAFAFIFEDVLGIFAAVASFAFVAYLHFKR